MISSFPLFFLFFFHFHPLVWAQQMNASTPHLFLVVPQSVCQGCPLQKRHTKQIRRHLSPRHIDNKHIHHPIIKRQREGRGVGDKEDSLLFSLRRHQSSNGPSVFLASTSLHAHFKDITADPEHEASGCNTEPPLSSICCDRALSAHGALFVHSRISAVSEKSQ